MARYLLSLFVNAVLTALGLMESDLPFWLPQILLWGGLSGILITGVVFFVNKMGIGFTFSEKGLIPFEKATQIAYNETRKRINNGKLDKKNSIAYEAHPYHIWRGYPLYGKKTNSDILEPLNNLENINFVPKIEKGGQIVHSIGYTNLRMKKSDLKKYLKVIG